MVLPPYVFSVPDVQQKVHYQELRPWPTRQTEGLGVYTATGSPWIPVFKTLWLSATEMTPPCLSKGVSIDKQGGVQRTGWQMRRNRVEDAPSLA